MGSISRSWFSSYQCAPARKSPCKICSFSNISMAAFGIPTVSSLPL
jgi:hypothetical protein